MNLRFYTSATRYIYSRLPPQSPLRSDSGLETFISSWRLDRRNNSKSCLGQNHAALSRRSGTAVSRALASASSPPNSDHKRQVEERNMVIMNKSSTRTTAEPGSIESWTSLRKLSLAPAFLVLYLLGADCLRNLKCTLRYQHPNPWVLLKCS
jgi:hypothetical protein